MEIDHYKNPQNKDPISDFLMEELEERHIKQMVKKIDIFKRKSTEAARKAGELEKIRYPNAFNLYELKFKTSPPIRMIGIPASQKYLALHIFIKKYDGPIKNKEVEIAIGRANDLKKRNKLS